MPLWMNFHVHDKFQFVKDCKSQEISKTWNNTIHYYRRVRDMKQSFESIIETRHPHMRSVSRCKKLPCEQVHVFGLMKHLLVLPTHKGSMFLLTMWPVLCYGVTLSLRKPHVPTSSRHRVPKGEMISHLRGVITRKKALEIPLRNQKSHMPQSGRNPFEKEKNPVIWELMMITFILYGIESKTSAQDAIKIAYSSISTANQSWKDKDLWNIFFHIFCLHGTMQTRFYACWEMYKKKLQFRTKHTTPLSHVFSK